ncbi:MAG: GNAT family N-acetyltransferase [Caldilineaceae bacterium]
MRQKPQVKILASGDEPALEAFLAPQIDASMFLISNLRQGGLTDTGLRYSGTYAAAWEEDQIIGVVAHYWNGNLICQATSAHLAPLSRAAVATSGRAINGIIGPAAQVAVIAADLDLATAQIQMDETEGLYALALADLVTPPLLQRDEVHSHRIDLRDRELLVAWRVAYNVESLYAQETPALVEDCQSAVDRAIQEGITWVLEVNGRPVATTAFNATLPEAVQVGGVWTPPELRCRGYARAVVAASLLAARDQGVTKAILFTGDTNYAAQKAYRALGFQRVRDYRLLLFVEGLLYK